MKRLMDVALSFAALLLLSPLLLATALCVALDSGWPVLFVQHRVGRGGREFGMLKFRSMVRNADTAGSYMTGSNDPRITRIGRLIRRASLDELPQLLNVLKGEMSLVGPRPDVPAQRFDYSESDWCERCSVRPGLTGLAQARLRSQATAAERLALDLHYVRQHGIALDLKILGWTFARLGGRGSN
jgi:lipopolysaccharide/colanic/teichoic acid biosynthesis glycosyltransferase